MVGLQFWRRFRRIRQDQAAVQALRVKEAETQAAAELRALAERRKILEGRLGEARQALAEVVEPEAIRLSWKVNLALLTPLLLGLLALAVWANLWGLEAFTALDWTKRLVVALSLPSLALVGGWAVGTALRMAPGTPLRKVKFGVGFAMLVLAVLGTVTVNVVRGLDTARLEEARRTAVITSDDLTAEASGATPSSAEAPADHMAVLFTVASTAMGVAGELGAAYLFDQLLLLLIPVWTVARLRGEVRRLEEELIGLAVDEETLRHRADLVRAQVATEVVEVEEIAVRDPDREATPSPEGSLAPLAWKILLAILLFAAVVAGTVVYARRASAEGLSGQTVVLIDLSTSARSRGEFADNLLAVEGLIRRTPSGHRLSAFGITEASFGRPALLVSTSPAEAGRYGELLRGWQARLIAEWRRLRAQLVPSAKGSDLFGAIARATLEFAEDRAGEKRLVILSDMRQVGRGFNFERAVGHPVARVAEAHRLGLVPRLDGVEVWVLGAHTADIDERQWKQLRAFWQAYFQRAGAELRAFTPNRRLAAP